MSVAYPSGQQYELRHGETRAVITEMGAGLRDFLVGGVSFLDTYSQESMPTACRGEVLLPFPNRIATGRYTFRGTDYQLPINEVALHNAIHGLIRWMNWQAIERDESRLVITLVLHAQPGYPFVLSLQITYTLNDGRLDIETTAHNIGREALPYGVGFHPYFTVGSATIDADLLQLPARSYFEADQQSIPLLPAVSVADTPYDFRAATIIGERPLDTGFNDLIRDADGFARVRFAAADSSRSVTLHLDQSFQCLQVYTGDKMPASERRRGLAIEPYTCAPNAFNNGIGLITLEPGQSFTNTWGFSVSL